MPEIQPLPSEATDPNANLDRGNPRYGFGTAMPVPVYFVLVTVIWRGFGVLLQLIERPGRVDAFYLIARAVGALVLGAVLTAIMAGRQRRNGGREAAKAMHTALRTGELPAGADRATWEPALRWRARQFRNSRWLMPVVCAAFAAIAVWLILLDPHELIVGLVTAALFVALAVWQEVLIARRLPNIRRLQMQLDGRR